jgi:hypothetical protein
MEKNLVMKRLLYSKKQFEDLRVNAWDRTVMEISTNYLMIHLKITKIEVFQAYDELLSKK